MEEDQSINNAVDAADQLAEQILADLDVQAGGVGWMTDQIGWRYSSLIADYTLSSIHGVQNSLKNSSLCVNEYRKIELNQNLKLSNAEDRLNQLSSKPNDEISKILGSEKERLLDIYRDHSLFSLAQTLDRMSAIIIAIVGVKFDLLRADWNNVLKLAKKAKKYSSGHQLKPGIFAEAGSLGRTKQIDLLSSIDGWKDYGPADWLPWLVRYRNTVAHRAPFLNWTIPTKPPYRSAGDKHIRPFFLQPNWGEVESMYKKSRHGVNDLLLLQSPTTVLDGLTKSTADFSAQLFGQCKDLWIERRDDPEMIIQHAGMWPKISSNSEFQFRGYGEAKKSFGATVFVSPERAKRMQAFRLLENLVHNWQ